MARSDKCPAFDAGARDRKPLGHPAETLLWRFVTGGTSRAENRATVAHLLGGCARCSRVVTAALCDVSKLESR